MSNITGCREYSILFDRDNKSTNKVIFNLNFVNWGRMCRDLQMWICFTLNEYVRAHRSESFPS